MLILGSINAAVAIWMNNDHSREISVLAIICIVIGLFYTHRNVWNRNQQGEEKK